MTENETKGRIQQKAKDLFMQYGLRSVSMDDIANALGISKKTIYHYFVDKDELVDAVMWEQIIHNQDCCTQTNSIASNAIHEVFQGIDLLEEICDSMNPSMMFELQKYHPKTFLKLQKHKNDFLYTMVRQNLERGIKEELYRDDINIEVLSRFRVDSLMLPFHPEFNTLTRYSIAEMAKVILENFMFGLVNMKGYKLILKYKQERQKLTNYVVTKNK